MLTVNVFLNQFMFIICLGKIFSGYAPGMNLCNKIYSILGSPESKFRIIMVLSRFLLDVSHHVMKFLSQRLGFAAQNSVKAKINEFYISSTAPISMNKPISYI